MTPRYALLGLALAACSQSAPSTAPSPTPSPTAVRGIQLRVLSAEVPRAECPTPAPDANPPEDASGAMPGLSGICYRVNESRLTIPRVADATVSESAGAVTLTVTLPPDLVDELATASERVRNQHVTLAFDGVVLASFPMTQPIADGRIVLSGFFSRTEADDLAARLRGLR